MILALPADVRERLEEIERRKGIPAIEICHQPIAVWSQLQSEDERKMLGFEFMRVVMYRNRPEIAA